MKNKKAKKKLLRRSILKITDYYLFSSFEHDLKKNYFLLFCANIHHLSNLKGNYHFEAFMGSDILGT